MGQVGNWKSANRCDCSGALFAYAERGSCHSTFVQTLRNLGASADHEHQQSQQIWNGNGRHREKVKFVGRSRRLGAIAQTSLSGEPSALRGAEGRVPMRVVSQ